MNCKICNKPSKTQTCSIEHGMIWRFLKDKNLNTTQIQEIININSPSSIKIKFLIWNKGLKSHPTCKICQKPLSDKKIIRNSKTSNTCSPKCYKKSQDPKIKMCEICGNYDCKSKKCSSIKREILFHGLDIIKLKDKFPNIPLEQAYKLELNNINEIPKCKFCENEHFKTDNFRILDCCSVKCSNVYKFNKKSYNDIKQYYLSQGVPKDFLENIDKLELARIYNNKKRKIKQCNCGKWYIDKCPNKCSNRQHLSNLSTLNKDTFLNFVQNNLFDIKQAMDYFKSSETFIRRFKAKFEIQEPCKNSVEDEIFELIGNCKRNDRTLIYPKEIDILTETFGIEYNGLIWHSEGNSEYNMFNNKNLKFKHLEKTNLVESKGFQLFHIFENEWLEKKQIWSSIINNKLNKNNKIFARKTIIKELTNIETNNFLEENHLQGKSEHNISLGLFYDNKLVYIMCFNKQDDYELTRFCSKLGITVIGGMSKLLKYFELKYKPKRIITYANRRWSVGNSYEKLGFKFIENTEPRGFIFKPGENKLSEIDIIDKTEIFNTGHRIIYDSGNKIYIKEYKY